MLAVWQLKHEPEDRHFLPGCRLLPPALGSLPVQRSHLPQRPHRGWPSNPGPQAHPSYTKRKSRILPIPS